MTYQIQILRKAQKALARIQDPDYKRIVAAIEDLAEDPRPPGSKKLTGRDGWRIRIGRYRVIYEIEDAIRIVTILDIGHRSSIYR